MPVLFRRLQKMASRLIYEVFAVLISKPNTLEKDKRKLPPIPFVNTGAKIFNR